MSEAKQIMPVIEVYLTDLIRRVVEELSKRFGLIKTHGRIEREQSHAAYRNYARI